MPGAHTVCTVLRLPGGGGSTGCGPADAAGLVTGHEPMGSVTVGPWRWRPHRRLLLVVLPDGSSSARLERRGGVQRPVAITGSAVLVRPLDADRIAWIAPDGSRRGTAIR